MPTEIGLVAHYLTVFWHCWLGGRKDIRTVKASDVVWDRRSYDKTGPRPKKINVLVLRTVVLFLDVWCCVVKLRCCHARRHNDREGHCNFSSIIYCFSILCCGTSPLWLWRSTVAFTYLMLNARSAFVHFRWSWSLIWSCLHHWSKPSVGTMRLTKLLNENYTCFREVLSVDVTLLAPISAVLEHWPINGWFLVFLKVITLRASCGAVYCNRSCLWVVCVWVCYHDNSKLLASILTKLGL